MKKGFTLIELVIVISVVVVLFGIGMSNFRSFARRQAVFAASRQVMEDLRTAQTNANIGNKTAAGDDCACGTGTDTNCGDPNDAPISGWKVENAAGGYAVKLVCQDPSIPDKQDYFRSLPAGITLAWSDGVSAVRFNVLGRGTDLDRDITLDVGGFGNSVVYQVGISQSGEVTNLGKLDDGGTVPNTNTPPPTNTPAQAQNTNTPTPNNTNTPTPQNTNTPTPTPVGGEVNTPTPTPIPVPVISSVICNRTKAGLDVSWTTVPGASSYELLSCQLDASSNCVSPGFAKIYQGASATYSHAGLPSGKTYRYIVRAEVNLVWSGFSSAAQGTTSCY